MGTVCIIGQTYWIRYRKNGTNTFESAKTKKKTVAVKLLTDGEDAVNKGREIITKHVNLDYLKNSFLMITRLITGVR